MPIYQFVDDFEKPDLGWFLTPGAGFDYGKGLADVGQGNAWVRNTSGWNAINHFFTLQPNTTSIAVQASLRLSDNLTDGYFSARAAAELNGEGTILKEIKLVGPGPAGPHGNGYSKFEFEFDVPPGLTNVLVYVGLWGVGPDAWIQVDDFGFQGTYDS